MQRPKPDTFVKGGLAGLLLVALALIGWPLYVLLHRNERDRP